MSGTGEIGSSAGEGLGCATRCVHAGRRAGEEAMVAAVGVATSSRFDRAAGSTVMRYPRLGSMTSQESVAGKLCALEAGASGCVLAGSGMGAISTALVALLGTGDHVVFVGELYGGTHQFAEESLPRMGVKVSRCGGGDVEGEVGAALTDATKVVYLETPSNPLLEIVDVAAVVALARRRGVLTVMDATFSTPVVCNPLAMGVDVVLHSGTKYLGGHSDLSCGAVLSASPDVHARVVAQMRASGGCLNGWDCYLLERSLKTLSLRVERQNASALALARFLRAHPRVARVYYPGLEEHPGHAIAARQMRAGMFGAMLSFSLAGESAAAAAVAAHRAMQRLQVAAVAFSLGGVETVVTFPAETSHIELSPETRAAMGITDALVRCSVGIEDPADLLADFAQALDAEE